MTIGFLRLELYIHNSFSLKDKRRVLKSIKDRLRKYFNVSISEISENDKWQLANLGVVTISTDTRHANQTLSKVVDFIEENKEIEISKYNIEML